MFFDNDLKPAIDEQSCTSTTFQRFSLRAVPRLIWLCWWEFEKCILSNYQLFPSSYTENETYFIVCLEWRKKMVMDYWWTFNVCASQSLFLFCLLRFHDFFSVYRKSFSHGNSRHMKINKKNFCSCNEEKKNPEKSKSASNQVYNGDQFKICHYKQ